MLHRGELFVTQCHLYHAWKIILWVPTSILFSKVLNISQMISAKMLPPFPPSPYHLLWKSFSWIFFLLTPQMTFHFLSLLTTTAFLPVSLIMFLKRCVFLIFRNTHCFFAIDGKLISFQFNISWLDSWLSDYLRLLLQKTWFGSQFHMTTQNQM